MHLVMDTIIVHELDFSIPDEIVAERSEEWSTNVLKTRSREEYIKGLAHFAGLDLIKYSFARVWREPRGTVLRVELRSAHWRSKQPK